jgi:hypothetical protein
MAGEEEEVDGQYIGISLDEHGIVVIILCLEFGRGPSTEVLFMVMLMMKALELTTVASGFAIIFTIFDAIFCANAWYDIREDIEC